MLESLRTIVQEVNAAKDFDEVLKLIVHLVKQATNTGTCSVYLYSPEDDSYILMATDGLNPDSVGNVRLSS